MMQNRKNVLDKAKTELADSINASNKIYTNEELSILVSELQEENKKLREEYSNSISQLEKSFQNRLSNLEKQQTKFKKTFFIRKYVTKGNVANTKIKISNFGGIVITDVKLAGDWAHINFGGYVQYMMGTIRPSNNNVCYGTGSTLQKAGNLADHVRSIDVDCSSDQAIIFNINMTCPTTAQDKGSDIVAFVTIYSSKEISDEVTVEFL